MLLRERYRRPTMAVLTRGAARPPCLLDWIIGTKGRQRCWSCPAPACPTTALLPPQRPGDRVLMWGPSSRGGDRGGRGARGERLVWGAAEARELRWGGGGGREAFSGSPLVVVVVAIGGR